MPGVRMSTTKYVMPLCGSASGDRCGRAGCRSGRRGRTSSRSSARSRRTRRRRAPPWCVSDARSLPAPGSLKSWHQNSEPSRMPGQVALVLLVGAGDEQRRAGPADADRVQRLRGTRAPAAPRRSRAAGRARRRAPTGWASAGRRSRHAASRPHEVGGVAALGGVLGQEGPDVVPELLGFRRQVEVHYMAPMGPDRSGGGADGSSGPVPGVVYRAQCRRRARCEPRRHTTRQ